MNTDLTREESSAIAKIRFNRAALGTLLAFLIIILILDAGFLFSEFGSDAGSSDVPEWLIIPFIIGIAAFGAVVGIISYLSGKLKDKEKAGFVRTSINVLKASKHLSARTEAKIFRNLARDLIRIPKSQVISALVADGWPTVRARFFTDLVESLIVKCEWNINYEDQVADFTKLLQKLRWTETEINVLVGPVVDVIKETGGRTTYTGVTVSILRNIFWIILILIMTPLIGWMLIGDKGLDNATKYDFLQFLIMAIPALLALGFNIVSIIRKLGKRPRDADNR